MFVSIEQLGIENRKFINVVTLNFARGIVVFITYLLAKTPSSMN